MTGTQTRTPARKKQARRGKSRKRARRFGWKLRLAAAGTATVAGFWAVGAVARHLAPSANTRRTRFDAIVVLGYPATADGDPSPRELASVTEAVREYERGVAPRLIFTGGAVANQFAEAGVMASAAQAQGIPPEAIFTEAQARDTIQNACYAVRLMQAHGWRSAEVIAHPAHLSRAAIIFRNFPIEWRIHAAPSLRPNSQRRDVSQALLEDAKTARYLLWGRATESCRP